MPGVIFFMTKTERKGLLIGIGFFAFFAANYINELIQQPLMALCIAIILFALLVAFVSIKPQTNNQYKPRKYEFKHQYNTEERRAYRRKKEIKKQMIDALRRMDPIKFEEYIRDLLIKSGYKKARCTTASNDGGKDIIATDQNDKLVYVECKRYAEDNTIGRPLIQKFHSAMIDGEADKGLFVTTSYFNKNAVKYAMGKNIELIDARRLIEMIDALE